MKPNAMAASPRRRPPAGAGRARLPGRLLSAALGLASVAVTLGCGPAPSAGSPAALPYPSSAHAHKGHASAEAGQEAPVRMEGEFGLWVRLDGDSVRASWVAAEGGPGFLEVSNQDGWSRAFETPRSVTHTAAFRPPSGTDAVLLTYGGREDGADRHRTRIRLEAGAGPVPPPVRITGVDSLFVVGDIHGEYDNMIGVLRNAGLIDDALRWSGGRSHLVVLGDMMSRGHDVTAVLWFLYGLEPQVEEAGGRLHVVLGNHEIMVMVDDLRYVQPKERWIAEVHGTSYSRMFDPRHSVLGRWLASKPAMLQVDDVLMAHGGVSDAYLEETPESHRDSLAAFMGEDLFYYWADTTVAIEMDSLAFERRLDFFFGDRSAFWYRGYAEPKALTERLRERLPEDVPLEEVVEERAEELGSVLDRYGARLHVIAHTPVPTIREAYGGSLVLVNTVDFASELLLLVRAGEGHERYRIGLSGPPQRLEAAAGPAAAGRAHVCDEEPPELRRAAPAAVASAAPAAVASAASLP